MVKPDTPGQRNFKSVATNPMLITVSLMGILLQFSAYAGIFGFVPIYAAGIGASSADLGLITMVNMAFSTTGALIAVWLGEKFGHRTAIILAALLIGGSLLAIPLMKLVPQLIALQVSYGLGRGTLMTTLMALSIRAVAAEHRATAMGVFQALYAVGMLSGPLISGIVGERSGLSLVFTVSALPNLVIIVLAFLPVFSRRRDV